MVSKVLLVGIAVVAAGIFALPATVAMFEGQHKWYPTDITSGGDEIGVPCVKCHADIAAELATDITPGDGGDGAQRGHQLVGCEGCHISGVNATATAGLGHAEDAISGGMKCSASCHADGYNGADNKSRGIGGTFHAAATVECVDCHNNVSFGSETHDVEGQITGEKAAHKPFYEAAVAAQNMSGANEACVGCHTHVRVNITWTHPQDMKFDANEDEYGTWTIENFEGTGTVTVETSGQ
ncbi:multiheme cytochrome [Candidatus Methanoperedenaceae archaeon GB37]|nr:multiheme cytochrome [Candidatus Methanoperedenaceae archaeon GB37]